MNVRSIIQKFLTPAAHLSGEQQRYFVLLTIAGSIGFLLHVLYIPLFYWMGVNILAIHSILALFVWSFMIWLGRNGQFLLSITLVGVEFVVYAALSTYLIGWTFGTHYILFGAAIGILVSYKQIYAKALWVTILSVEYIFLYFTAENIVWDGNPLIVQLFLVVNVMTVFGISFLFIEYQANLVINAETAMNKAFAQSEALLNNVMPSLIADRLKQKESVIADNFPETSILFADIVNFTPLSQNMAATEVVELLNDLFSRIDTLVYKHQLEKIKTIGDAYMVAAGVPTRRDDHAEAIVAFAFELQKTLLEFNHETGRNLQFRIGINSGPVVAGVIGKLRFLYDLWGDSVNTASRMESHGIPNEIQVTEETRNLLIGKYTFEDRGVIDVKGKGQMRTYLLRGQEENYA